MRAWSWLLSLFQRTGVPAQVTRATKPCEVTGCAGTMAFDDTEWPSYGTWVCDRDSGHRELVYGQWRPTQVKACTFAGCKGVMTLNDHLGPWLVRWFCEVNSDHFELETRGKIYRPSREEDMLRLRADMSHQAIDYEPPVKSCTVADCNGTMFFHDRMNTATGPPLELPWYATWVCAQNQRHFEVIPEAEYRQIAPSRSKRR